MLQKAINDIKEAQAPLTLDLCNCDIGADGAGLLADAMREANIPLTLNLKGNSIGEDGARVIADAIKEMQFPLTLNLYGNNLGNIGAGLLAEVIMQVKVPLNLNLGGNVIEDDGAALLSDAIKQAQAPITLGLHGNNIGDAGAMALAEAIKEARVPLVLDLSSNNIRWTGIMALAEAIKEIHALFILELSNNGIGGAVMALVQAIKIAQIPLNLSLSHNNIEETGVIALVQSLKEARFPLTLDLFGNNIRVSGAMALAEAIKVAQVPFTLMQLDVNDDLLLVAARENNFIIDAGSNPSAFLARSGFSFSTLVIEQKLGCPSGVAKIIRDYISEEDLAWVGVAAIREIEGASYENKYSSINWELLNTVYPGCFNNRQQSYQNLVAYVGQVEKEGNHTTSVPSALAHEDDGSGQQDGGIVSSSSGSSGSTPPGGGASDLELACQFTALSNDAKAIWHEQRHSLQTGKDEGDVSTGETLLKTLFAWIKDLSKDRQQKLLSSFSMQLVLELLDDTGNPHKFITDQLSSKPTEDIFATEYQSHYGQDNFENNATDYARVSQRDLISISCDEVISSAGILPELSSTWSST